MQSLPRRLSAVLFVFSLVISLSPALAHTKHSLGNATVKSDEFFGQPGAAKDVKRTVAIHTTDSMRFNPSSLAVRKGETVRLRITNDGKLPHEFVLGTKLEIDEHAKMMRQMPEMVHTDAHSARVAPGKSADILWTFSRAGTFSYACLIPGHREAGMEGVVTVTVASKR